MATEIQLTNYSKGSGCGCKIIPEHLKTILEGNTAQHDANVLVGNDSNDDAAVYALDNEQAIISTVDFFTPIVNDPFDFGCVAATNAISDVYAMGGKPFLATAILCWPTDTLPLAMAAEVIRGARSVCAALNVSLAGGHSVKGAEPMFGLSVNGIIKQNHIKRNNTVKQGDLLYLTKPLGIGILASAHKKNKLSESDYLELLQTMLQPNRIGEVLGQLAYVNAMTDVTGFGLMGHLMEMLGTSNLTAIIDYTNVPRLAAAEQLMAAFVYPDNTTNNYNAIKDRVQFLGGIEFLMLCDPQTSGGLIISVDPSHQSDFELILNNHKQTAFQIGTLVNQSNNFNIIIK
jgi:selenide, water dikinase